MSVAETRANGLFLFDTPERWAIFSLVDHNAEPFTQSALMGRWTLVFFGFTHCPDICPTTMAELAELKAQLADTKRGTLALRWYRLTPLATHPSAWRIMSRIFTPIFWVSRVSLRTSSALRSDSMPRFESQ